MENQLKNDFEKIVKTSSFSKKDIDIKKNYLNQFLKKGFPNRKLENWKFSDISQIIKKNIGDLDFYNDYSLPNKIDPSIFVNGLEHNKIVFINGRIEKIEFNYEDEDKNEILDEIEFKEKPDFENSLIDLNNAFLIITHYQRLLDYIKPDFVHVLMNGKIIKSGGPELALELEKKGYENFN